MSWVLIENDHQAFDTHLNYIKCLKNLMVDTKLSTHVKLKKLDLPFVNEKKNLISLTLQSLNDEYKIVQMDPEYSYASTSWLPIKSYYLIFNSLLSTEYVWNAQKSSYQLGHKKIIDVFTKKLGLKEIQFNEPLLNQVFDQSILNFSDQRGANLSTRIGIDRTYHLAMKKVAIYKFLEWKKSNNVNLRTKKGKTEKVLFLNNFQVSIFDFLYQMRIRANYRDFAFIDGVSIFETAQYFNDFYSFANIFFKVLDELRNEIIKMRS